MGNNKAPRRVKPWSNPDEQQIYFTEQRMLPLEKRDCPECRGTGKLTTQEFHKFRSKVPLVPDPDDWNMVQCRCLGTGRLMQNLDYVLRATGGKFRRDGEE